MQQDSKQTSNLKHPKIHHRFYNNIMHSYMKLSNFSNCRNIFTLLTFNPIQISIHFFYSDSDSSFLIISRYISFHFQMLCQGFHDVKTNTFDDQNGSYFFHCNTFLHFEYVSSFCASLDDAMS